MCGRLRPAAEAGEERDEEHQPDEPDHEPDPRNDEQREDDPGAEEDDCERNHDAMLPPFKRAKPV